LSDHRLKTGDIVFGRKGSVDRHAFIDEEHNEWLQGSDCIRVRCKGNEVNSHYLSHYLKLNHIKKFVNDSAVGSTMASLNTDILKDIPIQIPSIHEQDKIERLLSALDRKINCNQRINDNLAPHPCEARIAA
jgi:type I restriction enzyme S subunit